MRFALRTGKGLEHGSHMIQVIVHTSNRGHIIANTVFKIKKSGGTLYRHIDICVSDRVTYTNKKAYTHT